MQSCPPVQRASYGSPLRGYHSSSSFRHDDNVFPPFTSSTRPNLNTTTTRTRRISSNATDIRLKSSSYSDGRMDPGSPSFASGSPDDASHMACTMEYLADLVKEKKQLEMFPQGFHHVERLLDEEIARVRVALFQTDFVTEGVDLPEPSGEVITVTEKIYVPKREYPDYNFVGRILGPRGMTAKQLEQETGCKIMVRGKGSMRDKRKEDANRGKPNWEHLEDELHVLLQCEDTENRARIKLRAAMDHVKKLLVPAPEGTDELKRKQLMELAIINGTYRPYHRTLTSTRIMTPVPMISPIRAPIFVSPTSSPRGSPVGIIHTSPPSNPYLNTGGQTFDYSSFMSPSFLESALASFQMATNDMHMPSTYPTATSLVNSFPSLFVNNVSNSIGNNDSGFASAASPNK